MITRLQMCYKRVVIINIIASVDNVSSKSHRYFTTPFVYLQKVSEFRDEVIQAARISRNQVQLVLRERQERHERAREAFKALIILSRKTFQEKSKLTLERRRFVRNWLLTCNTLTSLPYLTSSIFDVKFGIWRYDAYDLNYVIEIVVLDFSEFVNFTYLLDLLQIPRMWPTKYKIF